MERGGGPKHSYTGGKIRGTKGQGPNRLESGGEDWDPLEADNENEGILEAGDEDEDVGVLEVCGEDEGEGALETGRSGMG